MPDDSNVDIYTHDLLEWQKNGHYAGWTDQAEEDGMVSEHTSIDSRIQAGQYSALSAMYDVIVEWLQDNAPDESEEE